MATVTKNWSTGTGSVTITYDGSGDGSIVVSSSDNNLHEARSMAITVETTAGSPTVTRTVTVSQAMKPYIDLTNAVVTAANQTYSGSALTPTPTVTLNGDTVPSTGYDVAFSDNTNAGTATITITGKGDYTGTATGAFTIAKANPTYTAPTAQNLTYSGSSQYLITTGSTSHGTIQYSTNGTSWSTTRPSGTDAGTYTAYWKLVGDANHNDVASTQIANVGIAQKALTITAKAQSVTYGTAITQGTGQITSSGLVSGHSVTAITLSQSTTDVTTTGTITPSAATVKQSSTDVTANYDITYNTGTLTITAATPSYTAPTAKTLTYSGSAQALVNAGSSSDGTFTYKLSSASSYSSSIPTRTNAGDYTVNWKFVADANHGGGTTTGNVSVTIAQKSLTITAKAQSISYGNSIATGTSQVTTSGLVSGDSLTAVTLTASTTNVTTTGTITPSAASTTKGAGNYSITYNTGNLTITAVPASVTAAPTAKTSLSYSRSAQSLVNAGTASGGTMYYYATTTNSKPSSTSSFSSSIPTKTNAGTYYVWYYVKGDSNHTNTAIASTSVSVTIAKATPVINTAPSKRTGLSYTGSAQNLLSGGSVKHSSTDSTSVSGTFTYAQGTNAGTYSSLTWSFAPTSSTNYNSINGTVSGSVTIAKVNPTYTAPVALTGLVADGSYMFITSAGSTSHGTIYYSLNGSSWSTSRVAVQAAGTYTSYWKLTGDVNHNDVSSTSLTTKVASPLAVDLGLPSGLLWAQADIVKSGSTYKIGDNEEDYGCMFSWGNTDGHNSGDGYDWGTSPTGLPYSGTTGGSISSDLGLSNDAARVNLGSPWRMPTKTEIQELCTNCTVEWTTVNGIKGCKFTSKISGYTNRWIFIPGAGYGTGTTVNNRGYVGYHWTSTYRASTHCQDLYFDFNGSVSYNDYSNRHLGMPIRAVM